MHAHTHPHPHPPHTHSTTSPSSGSKYPTCTYTELTVMTYIPLNESANMCTHTHTNAHTSHQVMQPSYTTHTNTNKHTHTHTHTHIPSPHTHTQAQTLKDVHHSSLLLFLLLNLLHGKVIFRTSFSGRAIHAIRQTGRPDQLITCVYNNRRRDGDHT